MRSAFSSAVTRFVIAFNGWLSSEAGFIQASVFCAVWTVLALTTHIDDHGFWLLFALTVASALTQFNVMIEQRRTRQTDEDMTRLLVDMAGALQAIVREIRSDQEEALELAQDTHDLVEEIHRNED